MIHHVLNRFRHANWPIADQVLVSGGNFLTIAICANLLPLSEQGKLGHIFAWYFGTIILNASFLFQHASVKAPSEESQHVYREKLAMLQMLVAVGASGFVALLIFGLSSVGIKGLSLEGTEIILMAIFLCCQQLADFSRRSAYIFEAAEVAAKLSMVQYFLRILLLFALSPTNVSTVLLILIVTSLWSVRKTLLALLYSTGQTIAAMKSFIGRHVSESKWFMASGPMMWLYSSIPVFFLGGIVDAAAIATFFSIRSLSNIGNVAMELLETEFAARIGRYCHEGGDMAKKSIKVLRLVGLVFWAVGLMLIVLIGDLVVEVVFGDAYKEYSWLLLILWLANGIVFLYRLNGVHLRTIGKSDVVTKSYSLGALMVLLAGAPLIVVFGLAGGASLMIIGAAMILFGQYWFARSAYVSS